MSVFAVNGPCITLVFVFAVRGPCVIRVFVSAVRGPCVISVSVSAVRGPCVSVYLYLPSVALVLSVSIRIKPNIRACN